MYIIRWISDNDVYTASTDGYPWSSKLKRAKLFYTKQEACDVLKEDSIWSSKATIEFIHPLNLG